MWPRGFIACIPSALILSSVALAQNTQEHPPDHRLQLVGARQLAVKSFSTLAARVEHWALRTCLLICIFITVDAALVTTPKIRNATIP